jgi:hypothetical protein
MKILFAAILIAGFSNANASGLDDLEPKPSAIPGLPDLKRPVFLSPSSLVCGYSDDIVGASKTFRANAMTPLLTSLLQQRGCAFSDKATKVQIELPDARSEQYFLQKQWRYVAIIWRGGSGQRWLGYTMIDNLHN